MDMVLEPDINRRYLLPREDRPTTRRRRRFRRRVINLQRLVLLPCLFATSGLLWTWLRILLALRRAKTSLVHQEALNHVDHFVEQYPLHLYPVVAKSLEMAFLLQEIKNPLKAHARFLEIAIGDGSFSARIFPRSAKVVGLELLPYYLKIASEMPHIESAIVCDCLEPPIRHGSFEVIVANNFLHHVTEKKQTLENWSKIASVAIFNENTPYWASAWSLPFLLRKVGLSVRATRITRQIEQAHFQCLQPKSVLDECVKNSFEINRCESFLSERTFFYCGLFSLFMRCSGPPTPKKLKRLFLGWLRRCIIPLTRSLARMLILFDAGEDRTRDAFVSYHCTSRRFVRSQETAYELCPSCRVALPRPDLTCPICGQTYQVKDGMLFLLRKELYYIESGYDPKSWRSVSKEYL